MWPARASQRNAPKSAATNAATSATNLKISYISSRSAAKTESAAAPGMPSAYCPLLCYPLMHPSGRSFATIFEMPAL